MCYSSMNCTIPLHIVHYNILSKLSPLVSWDATHFSQNTLNFSQESLRSIILVSDAILVLLILKKHIECVFFNM